MRIQGQASLLPLISTNPPAKAAGTAFTDMLFQPRETGGSPARLQHFASPSPAKHEDAKPAIAPDQSPPLPTPSGSPAARPGVTVLANAPLAPRDVGEGPARLREVATPPFAAPKDPGPAHSPGQSLSLPPPIATPTADPAGKTFAGVSPSLEEAVAGPGRPTAIASAATAIAGTMPWPGGADVGGPAGAPTPRLDLKLNVIERAFRLDELGVFGDIRPSVEAVEPSAGFGEAPATMRVDRPQDGSEPGAPGALQQITAATAEPTSAYAAADQVLPEAAIRTDPGGPVAPARAAYPGAAFVVAADPDHASVPEMDSSQGPAPRLPRIPDPPLSREPSLIVAGPLDSLEIVVGVPEPRQLGGQLLDALSDAAGAHGGAIKELSINGGRVSTPSAGSSGGPHGHRPG
jgi:hypothetical protein